ncbi:MAG: hypothetical protein GY839_11350 [candidate division Zixibacteria bacterium]|nr:hypothetical protein [candidate division Zixibacteria bacterium]
MDISQFTESLELALELTIDDDSFTIPGGNVKSLKLNLHNYGFDGDLVFWETSDQHEDKLISAFAANDLIDVTLSVKGVHNLPSSPPDPLTIKAIVTAKQVHEEYVPDVKQHPVMYRKYTIKFEDPAHVLWKQHFPTDLFITACMKDVIEAQVVEGIELTFDWPTLDETKPMICLGLGGPGNEASFYDFLIHYLTVNDGILTYDYEDQSYIISGEKSSEGETVSFLPHEIKAVQMRWPETARHNVNILNALYENATTEPITQDQAADGINHDQLIVEPIQSRFDSLKELETRKLKIHGPELTADTLSYPYKIFWPGTIVELKGKAWSKDLLTDDNQYRIFSQALMVEAVNADPENDLDQKFTQYYAGYRTLLEEKDSDRIYRPDYIEPGYPIQVEGMIVSEEGKDPGKTFQVEQDSDTQQDLYRITIPLWDKEIKILYKPDFLNPHLFFPLYRDNKLLLALDLYEAKIIRILDWGDRVRLPMETQGNHILFGKNDKDETSMRYVYKDNKPVLSIKRLLENDTELFQMEEGVIILETKEE